VGHRLQEARFRSINAMASGPAPALTHGCGLAVTVEEKKNTAMSRGSRITGQSAIGTD